MATVLVVGLGDLGGRVLEALAGSRRVERLVGSGRDDERGAGWVGQCRLVAELRGGPGHVEFARNDVADVASTAALLRRLDPALVVTAASRHTWRRRPVAGVPYGAWLPLQLPLVRELVRARNDAGVAATVVCLPYPDGVGPALAPLGLAPDVGAGNVTETAPKLALLAGPGATVRLVMHHAAQRCAFGAFAALADGAADEPPFAAEVRVGGARLPEAQVRLLFARPWPLAPGAAVHGLTAAATAHLVEALLADRPSHTHAPAPGGRAGGYPVVASSGRVVLDLPDGLAETDAVALNERAARWDGLERVEPDGTLVFTEEAATATGRVLGLRLERVPPHDVDAVADELERARTRLAAQPPGQSGG